MPIPPAPMSPPSWLVGIDLPFRKVRVPLTSPTYLTLLQIEV
jgi:hypothetical protein